MDELLLEVKNVKKYFPVKGGFFQENTGFVRAVDDVSLQVRRGETFGFVGESGCGKSTLSRVILRLTEADSGSVLFEGKNIFELKPRALRAQRKEMQMVFQKPFESLNPRKSVGKLIREPLDIHTKLSPAEKETEVKNLLELVGMSASVYKRFPHEFSGGQRQRIGIARAIALRPKLVICDEPVSALDVSIQSQILNLLKDIQSQLGLTYIFISHNLSVVKHVSDRIGVMYLGKLVEIAGKDEMYSNTLHPYTKVLISAIPVPDPLYRKNSIRISDDLPSPINPPKGCRFCTRCYCAMPVCRETEPGWYDAGNGHRVACHLYDGVKMSGGEERL